MTHRLQIIGGRRLARHDEACESCHPKTPRGGQSPPSTRPAAPFDDYGYSATAAHITEPDRRRRAAEGPLDPTKALAVLILIAVCLVPWAIAALLIVRAES